MERHHEDVIVELRRHGEALRAARAEERLRLDAIADLIPKAVAAGVSRHEIARLTGVGRPWINRVLARE